MPGDGERPRGEVFAAGDVVLRALGHGGAGAGDVSDEFLAVEDEALAIGDEQQLVARGRRGEPGFVVGEIFSGHDEVGPDVEDFLVGAQRLGLDLGGAGVGFDVGVDALEEGVGADGAAHDLSDPVDVAHGPGDLEVAALVEVFDGDGEGAEGLAPELVDAFFAAAMQHEPPQGESFLQAAAAFAHQFVVRRDFDAELFELGELGEDVGGAVEERAGEHRALDALLLRVGFRLIGRAGFIEPFARDVEAVLDVVEEAPGEGGDEGALGLDRIFGDRVRLDPVAVVIDPFDAVDDAPRAVGRRSGAVVGHRCKLFLEKKKCNAAIDASQ